MAFWTNTEGLEPKRSYRFTLSIPGSGNDVAGTPNAGIKEFLIEKVKKPGFAVGESEVKYLNHSFFYPGKVTWDEVTFDIIDVLEPQDANGTIQIMKMLQEAGYEMPEAGSLKTISKAASVKALGRVQIHQYPASGVKPSETWVLNGAWIKQATFGDLDYGAEDMQKVSITLKYDNAYLDVPGDSNYPSNAKS